MSGKKKDLFDDGTPLGPDEVLIPSGGRMSKVEVYGWEIVDSPGKFKWIEKGFLNVDDDYQRDNLNLARVVRIASAWSWVRLGTLLVAERPDTSLWVFDGQHRKLGADRRSDITKLPCMVFASTGMRQEAGNFLNVNSDRGPVKSVDTFKAKLVAGDPVATSVKKLIGASKYEVRWSSTKSLPRSIGSACFTPWS